MTYYCPPEPPADPRLCPLLQAPPEGETPQEHEARRNAINHWIAFDGEARDRPLDDDPFRTPAAAVPDVVTPCCPHRQKRQRRLILRSDGKVFMSAFEAGKAIGTGHATVICAMGDGRLLTGRGRKDKTRYRFYCLQCVLERGRQAEAKYQREKAAKAQPQRTRKAA